MYVIKRSGEKQDVSLNKIHVRLSRLSFNLNIDPWKIAIEVISNIELSGIHTRELDVFAAQRCASKSVDNIDYGILAARLAIDNHQKNTSDNFLKVTEALNDANLLSQDYVDYARRHSEKLEDIIDYKKDFLLNYFGFSTLEKKYLLKVNGKLMERPQHLWMRLCVELELKPKKAEAEEEDSDSDSASESNEINDVEDDDSYEETKDDENLDNLQTNYELVSSMYFIHASSALFGAGLKRPQMSSCFLMGTQDDSEAILKTLSDAGLISKSTGGIGWAVSNIRSDGMPIAGTGGNSNGVPGFLPLANQMMKTFDQGGGKRPGSMAVYIEMHHPDLLKFLNAKRPSANKETLSHIFPALWVCDLFMMRVLNDEVWSFFDPTVAPELVDLWGNDYNKHYIKLEREEKYTHQMRARELWKAVYECQCDTGTPYIMFKDQVNRTNNQCNFGTIRSSNLCCEVVEYSDEKLYAVCTLASICLPKFVEFVNDGAPTFNWKKFEQVVRQIVRNLNAVIDLNWYPRPEAELSNKMMRPIGIGVQGLSDLFFLYNTPFGSDLARALNREIFEKLYFYALSESSKLSRADLPYEKFRGSILSFGGFQYDLYPDFDVTTLTVNQEEWEHLHAEIISGGVRNSLLIAQMPTASTSQIAGNTEGIDPLTSNIYRRETLAGDFLVINPYLNRKLSELGLLNDDTLAHMKLHGGSIQGLQTVPADVREVFKTAWEISMRDVIEMAADRGKFIDQSQSMNLWCHPLTFSKFNSMIFHGWKNRLKTGVYYMRTKPSSEAKKVINEKIPVICTDDICTGCQ